MCFYCLLLPHYIRHKVLLSCEEEHAIFCCQINENMDQWPHLNELVQCYKADWVVDENKYGHYEGIGTPSFQSQIFEGPDTDIETGTSFN